VKKGGTFVTKMRICEHNQDQQGSANFKTRTVLDRKITTKRKKGFKV
jgi:hypothetical protein